MAKKLSLYERHEQDVADILGGKCSVSSGRKWYSKGDGKTSIDSVVAVLWDCKSTQKKSYRLTYDTWQKVSHEAAMEGREPILPLRFLDDKGKVIADFVVVRETHLCCFPSGVDAALAAERLSGETTSSMGIKVTADTPFFFALKGLYHRLPLVLISLDDYVKMMEEVR